MTLQDFKDRIAQARKRVAHYVSGVAIAERRIKHFKKRYVVGATGGHPALKERARKRLRYWLIRKAQLEQLEKNWRGLLRRRTAQKVRYLKNHPVKPTSNAVFDGCDVPPWMVGQEAYNGQKVNWLQKIRDAGWSGVVVSGVRTPEHSIELCYQMCGAPSCPGRCAGATSNHNCADPCPPGGGAIDVSDYYRFGAICKEIGCPLRNALPIDPVHYSVSGN